MHWNSESGRHTEWLPLTNDMNADTFTPEHDITETLPDGRMILLAPAGVPIPMHVAIAKGFVKPAQPVQPAETKEEPHSEPATEGLPPVSVSYPARKRGR
jgi:hypothetical protein